MSHKVLVTGGAGFIGSYILRLLAESGHTVISFDVQPPRPEAAWLLKDVRERIVFVQGNIDNWSDVVAVVNAHHPDSIIHLAAIGSPVVLKRQPSLALNVNVHGTFHILEVARLFGIQRVVYFSSIGVLPGIQYEPVDANHPLLTAHEGAGASFYGASKITGEAFCWAYHQSYGLDFIVLRPSAVYGFGMFLPIYIKPMVENAVRGLPTRFEQGGDFPRDYTHVADVAQLALKAVEVPAEQVKDRVFFAATGQPLVTASQAAQIVREAIPNAAIQIGAGLSEDDLVEIRYRGVLSIQNAQEQLGYEPRFAHVRDGVADYITLYQRYLSDMA